MSTRFYQSFPALQLPLLMKLGPVCVVLVSTGKHAGSFWAETKQSSEWGVAEGWVSLATKVSIRSIELLRNTHLAELRRA